MCEQTSTDGHFQTYLDHIWSHKANTTGPALRGVVQNVIHAETLIFLSQLIKLLLEQDIVRVDVGEDQIHLSSVLTTVARTVANDGLNDLQHRSDTGTTGDHPNVTAHVGGVHHGALGSAHLHGLPDMHLRQVLGDVTLGIRLDEQVEIACLMVRGNGGVRADDLLGLTGDAGGERDMLTDGQTQDVGGVGQSKAVDGDIVGDLGLLLQSEMLEFGGVQDLARLYGAEG